ncbi:MAG: 2-succinyl-5-enolpyruvyl-6-hydroxy-3-cyclohexene-carboxylate synthase, partial [Solirubrobacteraceae bacterium]|nr:2-succinyl-5-enolpyruvyl-6-hydroxy-3-cyclohexene-carboxylate synthase [Solirubrobacteraceae bacterium]
REPLVLEGRLPDEDSGRSDGAPALERGPDDPRPAPDPLAEVLAEIELRPRGVIVCGRWERDAALGAAVAGLSETAGYPVLADPLSGARREGVAIAHYDALLRAGPFSEANAPELVLRVGDLPTSKPLRAWLAAARDAFQLAIDRERSWQDPDGVVSYVLPADPATTLAELTERVERAPDAAWVARWRDADSRAATAISEVLGGELSEPRVAAELGMRLPTEATLFVASSMPVRDVETFFPARDPPPRVLSNRGANGIDGTVSAAFGAAASGEGPVVLLIGDVALAHDIGGLMAAGRLGLKLVVVLLNNDGGGIFHFLPVAGERDAFEEHVATPHGLEFARAAALYGCEHELASDADGFGAALDRALAADGTTIVEVRTERDANVALHRRVWDAVAGAL